MDTQMTKSNEAATAVGLVALGAALNPLGQAGVDLISASHRERSDATERAFSEWLQLGEARVLAEQCIRSANEKHALGDRSPATLCADTVRVIGYFERIHALAVHRKINTGELSTYIGHSQLLTWHSLLTPLANGTLDLTTRSAQISNALLAVDLLLSADHTSNIASFEITSDSALWHDNGLFYFAIDLLNRSSAKNILPVVVVEFKAAYPGENGDFVLGAFAVDLPFEVVGAQTATRISFGVELPLDLDQYANEPLPRIHNSQNAVDVATDPNFPHRVSHVAASVERARLGGAPGTLLRPTYSPIESKLGHIGPGTYCGSVPRSHSLLNKPPQSQTSTRKYHWWAEIYLCDNYALDQYRCVVATTISK